MCVNECVLFKKVPSNQAAYRLCCDEQCPKCGEKRFDTRVTPSGNHYAPRKVFYHLGLRRAGEQLMANPAFVGQRGQGRDAPEDVYTSELAKNMDKATDGAVFNPNNSLYELFVDFAQTFTFKQHSMGVVAIRCDETRPATALKTWCVVDCAAHWQLHLQHLCASLECKSITPASATLFVFVLTVAA